MVTTTSTANLDLVKRLGADILMDYRKDDFETILHDCDLVLNSAGEETLEISTSAKTWWKARSRSPVHLIPILERHWIVLAIESSNAPSELSNKEKGKRHDVSYSFLLMKASGDSYARSLLSSILGSYAQSWIRSLHSNGPTDLSLHRKRTCKR